MTSETARLELINPYAKYGLKRRPTYDEIAGLIRENETLTGELPDRNATFFKKTPQGSFFDGLDKLDKMKEEHSRITQRQISELLLRQYATDNNVSLSVARQQMRSEIQQTQPILQGDQGAQAQALIEGNLQTMERLRREREEQTGIAHREGTFLGIPSLVESLGRTRIPTIGRETIPEARTPIGEDEGDTSPELIPDEEMTRRQEAPASASASRSSGNPVSSTSAGVLQFQQFELDNTNNPDYWISNYRNMTVAQIKFQLFLRGIQIPTTDSIEEQLKPKGRGKDEGGLPLRTYKEYLHGMILDTIRQGGWKIKMTNQEYEDEKKEWKRGKGKLQ